MSAGEQQSGPAAANDRNGTPETVVTPPGPRMLRTLRELRVEQGLSLRELAEASGVNKGTISQIERGRLVATRAELDAIAAILDRPLEVRTLVVYEERGQ